MSQKIGKILSVVGLESGEDETIIRHIAVLESAQRHGIGRMLLEDAVGRFGQSNLVAETDASAVDFYRACGFTVRALEERYPGVERFLCVGSN